MLLLLATTGVEGDVDVVAVAALLLFSSLEEVDDVDVVAVTVCAWGCGVASATAGVD